MLKNNILRSIFLAGLLVFFITGVTHLFLLRFQSGDVYPAYSSLRSDPLGTRAFYESLAKFENMTVRRNYHFLDRLQFTPATIFFYLGAAANNFDRVPKELALACDRLMQSGGRLVLSFLPIPTLSTEKKGPSCAKKEDNVPDQADVQLHDDDCDQRQRRQKETAPSKKEPQADKPSPQTFDEGWTQKKFVALEELWGIKFSRNHHLAIKDDIFPALEAMGHRPDLPSVISWHSNLFFDSMDNTWRVIYASEGYPVIVERSLGKGTIVLCADSFFISNEALWSERHPQLLVWLLGNHTNIIFDEAHLGIFKHPGVAALLRHYRFHWFFAGLTVIALLFVWKSAAYFIPPGEDKILSDAGVVSEKDSTMGLIALLRRNIPSRKILQICGREWLQLSEKDKRLQPATIARIKDVLQRESRPSENETDPVKGYLKISRIISEDRSI